MLMIVRPPAGHSMFNFTKVSNEDQRCIMSIAESVSSFDLKVLYSPLSDDRFRVGWCYDLIAAIAFVNIIFTIDDCYHFD